MSKPGLCRITIWLGPIAQPSLARLVEPLGISAQNDLQPVGFGFRTEYHLHEQLVVAAAQLESQVDRSLGRGFTGS
jgi:hypothetical protein